MDQDIEHIILAAENGGSVVKKYFGNILDIEEKSTISDFRTKADTESEKAILQVITKKFPHYNILSEEIGFIDNKSEYTFIVDPLDGSNNFVLGIPNFSISIGLVRNNSIVAGVVHAPILNYTYHAQKGKGSFLHKKELHVNKEPDIKRSTVSYTCGYINSADYTEKLKHKLNKQSVKRILDCWSPAIEYCLLASGKIEAIISNKTDIYDFIAGKIIAREAGALITNFEGKSEENDKEDTFIVSNGTQLHDALLKLI